MTSKQAVVLQPEILKELLGYLNFSSGSRDPKLFLALDSLFRALPASNKDVRCSALRAVEYLEQQLAILAKKSEAFHTDDQAGIVLALVSKHFIPDYRKYHADLLFHQTDELLFNSLFLGKIIESILRQGSPWTEHDRIVPAVISTLNDYIGYRPIPVLEGEEKHQPYAHEWVAPIPLYIDGVGVAAGKYEEIIQHALTILRETDPQILQEACLDPDKIQELVLDPRAYDFDHPVNRKPNYHFGLWDPNFIDNSGFYRRFVVHQVTLEGIHRRLELAYTGESDVAGVPKDELIYEAGAVLAGTMLMGAGVCGDTPSTFDSETSLNDLMPIIADYRDRFYNQMVQKIPGKMKKRILEEQQRLFQPFGGCRQDLNRQMAKRRADQLQRMHLARIFARMGYSDAAMKQATAISVTSARILTTIDCLITETHTHIDHNKLIDASRNMPKIEDLIRRGISCGALIDPWTILGFGGVFSLFHTIENSIHDHRIDEIINLLEEVFDIYSRLQKEAAATGNGDLQADLSDRMSDLAGWWDQYGTTDVNNIESFSGNDAWESAAVVSTALAAWHKAGTSAGDVAFWSRHVERFKTTKAFVLLAEALLDQQDPVAAMNLMMYWLERSEQIPLIEGDYSFHAIAVRWMDQIWKPPKSENESHENETNVPIRRRTIREVPTLTFAGRWKLTRKFFELMEANADIYWQVPTIDLDDDFFAGGKKGTKDKKPPSSKKPKKPTQNPDEDVYEDNADDGGDVPPAHKRQHKEDRSDSIYGAAYDEFTYKDSTDDGIDDALMDQSPPGGFNNHEEDLEIVGEMDRIGDRLLFISTMSKLWKFVAERLAGFILVPKNSDWQLPAVKNETSELTPEILTEIEQNVAVWLSQMITYGNGLGSLLDRTSEYNVPPPRGTVDSLMEYDRHRGFKEILLDRIIWTHVEVLDTQMTLESYLGYMDSSEKRDRWEKAVFAANKAMYRCDVKTVKKEWNPMLKALAQETILYIPTSRGGSASAIVLCRQIQQAIIRLLEYAPRLGLVSELFKLLETIQTMEEKNTVSPGAITEFDRLVETASRAMTKCIAASTKSWKFSRNKEKEYHLQNEALVKYMEQIIEHLLSFWLEHSKQIRISPVEVLVGDSHPGRGGGYWEEVRDFIQRYGHDIFTQQNMGFGNLRAILHQGVSHYLKSLMKIKNEDGEVGVAAKLLEDLEKRRIHWEDAASCLEIILESIAENYSEYVDYNSTTTHSDHGEKLYMLLDMLRTLVGYERISWNLKPVYWVHDSMIRAGCDQAAFLWERAVAKRSVTAAEEHLRLYQRLSEKYGMWLPSVHERLQERFVRPLQIARMCGLVPKAIRQSQKEESAEAFNELYMQVENFAKDPMGVGFEMPEWLSALRNEVMATRADLPEELEQPEEENGRDVFNSSPHFEQACITKVQLDKILQTLGRPGAR